MKRRLFSVFIFTVVFQISLSAQNNQTGLIPFNFNWLFHLGDLSDASKIQMSTKDWRIVDLPHDWSIEGSYGQTNGTDWQSGFLPVGIGWYRKEFLWDESWKNKKVFILFEGVYLNSEVWINGHCLGYRPNGYISFEYDISPYLRKDTNILAVRVDHSKALTGRWYTGSGIYRKVWLKVKNNSYIDNWGVWFRSPSVSVKKASYELEVVVHNESEQKNNNKIRIELFDREGTKVAQQFSTMRKMRGKSDTIKISGDIDSPILWSPENPYLYTLKTSILFNDSVVDVNILKVGFRNLKFSIDSGFQLNGKKLKFKGVCDHHTAGAVGAAVPDDVLIYRLRLLKAMGCNAIRTSHNPFSPSFYDICDSLGLMVLNEFLDGWDKSKAVHDYGLYFNEWWQQDAIAFIKRDRNHPSVVMWSLGNEIKGPTREVQKPLIDLFHQYDPDRPVTQGGRDPSRGQTGDGMPTLLDIKGFNGDGEKRDHLEQHHKEFPHEILLGTELPHTFQTRGVYRTRTHYSSRDFPMMWERKGGGVMKFGENQIYPIEDLTVKEVFSEEKNTHYFKDSTYHPINNPDQWAEKLYYQSSYDNATIRVGARKMWQIVNELPYVIGQFRWGSFDYLGETAGWPSRFANFGIIDICGFPKDHYYLYQSLWTDAPMVHILPHWTHPGKEGVEIPVVIYTNCEEVELYLNDSSLGTKQYLGEQLVWMVPYKKGTIKAVAKRRNIVVAESSHQTSFVPSAIKLSPDKKTIKANRTDVVHVAVDVLDTNGTFCPYANNIIHFEVSGQGKIIGVDNGDPLDLSAYKSNVRKTFRGKAMLLIQAKDIAGKITISAYSENLKSDIIEINVE